MKVRLKLSNQY